MGATRSFLVALCITLLSACASLPSLEQRTATVALRDTGDTRLGRAVAASAARERGDSSASAQAREADPRNRSGLHALPDGRDSLAARLVLAETAQRTLDIQYYIWRRDVSGMLMFKAISQAADRGVRVRLLLDDAGTGGLDETLRALNAHPRIEVRLFNPFVQRKSRAIGYLTDFARLNRRMHNKSFTADNQATIVGGRNIGDEYFDVGETRAFADLDVLAVGSVVTEVSADFDRYWASESAYPIERLVPAASDQAIAAIRTEIAAAELDAGGHLYADAVRQAGFMQALLEGRLALDWANTRLISDDPAKVLRKPASSTALPERFEAIFGQPQESLEMVSPYFVPMPEGTMFLEALARQGVRIRVLTNSLASTDVVAVHAGYARSRKQLLRAGIELHEYKPMARTQGGRGSGGSGAAAQSGGSPGSGGSGSAAPGGSSRSSLHAKTFSVDHSRVVIGSFNFDPRSVDLNTELGFVIESRSLARTVEAAYSRNVPQIAWQVTLTKDGDLRWTGEEDGVPPHLADEPQAGFWRRVGASTFAILPIDWLL